MQNKIKTSILFYMFTLFLCLNCFFVENTVAQDNAESADALASANYTFETIDVPGVEFLQLSASSDFGDYAGSTRSANGEKIVAFTLIDGIFTTYDFPGSKNTYFFALGNNGDAAGHYEDSDGLFHGVVLKDGELQQYDFPGAVQTELSGISDSTGALTGNFIDAAGVRRGFSADEIIEAPGATETYADFVNSSGGMVGSYVDAEGLFHPYIRTPTGRFASLDLPSAANLEYFFVHGINDTRVVVARAKQVDGIPGTLVGTFQEGLKELKVPGSVSTEGYNINQDGSIVGHYDSADGRRHGFIARPITDTAAPINDQPVATPSELNYTFESIDVPSVDFLAVTASSDFEDYAGYTRSADGEKEAAFTLIDGIFTTYDFPDSQKTHFYALGNNGQAAGYYQDSNGLSHGIVLQDGELRQYDFPGAVETEIYGISDATGALTGNFIDAAGVRRGFSGDKIVEAPEALATYADFVNASGRMVGSYIDTEGLYHPYMRQPTGKFISLDLPGAGQFEYFFVHGINDVGVLVSRSKRIGGVPRTHVGSLQYGLHEFQFPGSVSTEGWNINQDGSVVGHYTSADGRTHGFIARPAEDTTPPIDDPPAIAPANASYTFETIDVPGVDFLAVTASSDFEDYAGNTPSADGEKMVGFTLIDGVFTTYDFPGSQGTYFYALGNNGVAAGHYQDSDGLYHGVLLGEDGELHQYDFPGAVETQIFGYSDATGKLTGSMVDASGVRRGFSGETIVEYPGALETYADFVSGLGNIVGSYVDAAGTYHAYLRGSGGSFATLDLPLEGELEYFFLHGLNDGLIAVGRGKAVGDVPRTYVGNPLNLQELRVPDSAGTEGWNINQDGSVVGHYDSPDGRRHGFIAKPIESTDPRTSNRRIGAPAGYTFESIDVPGVDFLAVTASSDFEDYAGNTQSADGEKEVAFTLIDGVFTTYDFPGAQGTYFYALGNNGVAAGHYKDSDGLYHGVVLEDGELRQYDFPGAVETFIYGISDATGAMTGHIIDASGVRRGFSGDTIVEVPGASATNADFVSWTGHIVGSYTDSAGTYHAYMLGVTGRFLYIDLPEALNLEYFFLHGLNESRSVVGRAKEVGDVSRTYVGNPLNLRELQFPGSISTEGWNINQDGSVVGHYDSADGRRHGFIARPTSQVEAENYSNTYSVTLSKGLNMLSVPLASPTPMTAKSLVAMTGATTVIKLDAVKQHFIAWTPGAPNDGFPIEGGKGYIVNVPQSRNFAFVGAPWTNPTEAPAASPAITPLIRGDRGVTQEAWAFVVSGHLKGKPAFDGYEVTVRNLRTNSRITASVQGDYFAAATADLTRRSVVQVGDVVELRVIGPAGNAESQTLRFEVTPEHLSNAVLSVRLDNIGKPTQNLLMQNYPNPFNPETWIPYQLSEDSPVSISIYDTTGRLVRTLSLGFQSAGFYNNRSRAAYWDGRNELGERVASGIYFYQLTTPAFQQTRRLVILK